MSNNYNFYNNYHEFAFQNNYMPPHFVPPPPLPPPELFVRPVSSYTITVETDQEFVKYLDNITAKGPVALKQKLFTISQNRRKIRDLLMTLNKLKEQADLLEEKINIYSDEEWKEAIEEINKNKMMIKNSLSDLNVSHLDSLKKSISKRTAKRLRLKRLRVEKKRAKEDWNKEREERSRKIDENLQKIKDSINKAKQEEESKLKCDMVLKEVLRKKHNAKKFVAKLDAMKKLRKARLKTARGRGDNVSEKDAEEFDGKIDKLKLLWAQKLIVYEKEEEDLRTKLKEDGATQSEETNQMEKQVASNLKKWRKALFGDAAATPQADFNGDLARFVAVRHKWDQYLSDSGSVIPIGWVTPSRDETKSSNSESR